MNNDSIFTLYELLNFVKATIQHITPNFFWVTAEISTIKEDYSGHCYLTLIEKDDENRLMKARTSATIWCNEYSHIKRKFHETTGQNLVVGMKILILATPSFHEQYGFSLKISDIDPTFTLGDIEARKQETIRRIKEDGIWDDNRNIPLPILMQNIAVISSSSAAGYGDFCKHLSEINNGYYIKTTLYQSIMQGDKSAASIIDSLSKIMDNYEDFDAVVIIRGGGDSADLMAFDDYDLCSVCAQFPLPIITGLGHERDNSILDMVANTRCKTPTAVAEFIISKLSDVEREILDFQNAVFTILTDRLNSERNYLKNSVFRLNQLTTNKIRFCEQRLNRQEERLILSTKLAISGNAQKISKFESDIINKLKNIVSEEKHKIKLYENSILMMSPKSILKKGYTITTLNGKIVRDVKTLNKNDEITTIFSDGKILSIINKI